MALPCAALRYILLLCSSCHCIVLDWTVWRCIALCSDTLDWNHVVTSVIDRSLVMFLWHLAMSLHQVAQHSFAFSRMALHCVALLCIASRSMAFASHWLALLCLTLRCIALRSVELHRAALLCMLLCCIDLPMMLLGLPQGNLRKRASPGCHGYVAPVDTFGLPLQTSKSWTCWLWGCWGFLWATLANQNVSTQTCLIQNEQVRYPKLRFCDTSEDVRVTPRVVKVVWGK